MKKLFAALLLCFTLLTATAQMGTFAYYRVLDAGATVSLAPNAVPATLYIYSSGAVTLAANWEINTSSLPPVGTRFSVWLGFDAANLDLNGFTINVFGQTLTQTQIDVGGTYEFSVIRDHSASAAAFTYQPTNLYDSDVISGAALIDGTVPLTKLENLTGGNIVVGNSSNIPTSVSMSGDIAISNTGVTSIAAGAIVNADVNASAAIARSKLAAGTASQVLVNDGSGVMTSSATLSATLGGTALNTSASTGFPVIAAGTWSVATPSESETILVSFETGLQSDNKIVMPCSGTVTGLYAYATKVIAGTDNGTIIPKNNAGTTMGSGTITFTASDPLGTAYTSTPATNNTFVAGDILSFTTAKTTAGGVVQLTITYTRSN